MVINPLDGAYRNGLEVVRKVYRATMRNRAGKIYLTINWNWVDDSKGFPGYHNACELVRGIWPDAYTTSASYRREATFRLNPEKRSI